LAGFLGAGLAGAFFAALGAGFFFAGMAREVIRWDSVEMCRLLEAAKRARSVERFP
jgi:hypothetical protein